MPRATTDRTWVLLVRFTALGLLLLAGFSPRVFAQQRVVLTRTNGVTIEGELITQDDKTITLKVNGIPTEFPRDTVRSVEVKQSVAEEFAARRAELEDDNVQGRYNLAYWAYDKGELELAAKELELLAKAFPDEPRVPALLKVVQTRLKVKNAGQDTQPDEGDNTATDQAMDQPGEDEPVSTSEGPLPTQKLTEQDINTIKVWEIKLDNRPNVVVPREVLDEVLAKYAENPLVPKSVQDERALRRSPTAQLKLLFDLVAAGQPEVRKYYHDVIIRNDPETITTFKTQIHQSYVLNYCAAMDCHGGPEAGDFFLFRTGRTNSDPVVYTNFYILDMYPTGKRYDMLDRSAPDKSLLIQYGLSRELAALPHPDVPGWRPYFRPRDQKRIQVISDWIASLLSPRPSYDINYELPHVKKADSKVEPTPAVTDEPAEEGSTESGDDAPEMN